MVSCPEGYSDVMCLLCMLSAEVLEVYNRFVVLVWRGGKKRVFCGCHPFQN